MTDGDRVEPAPGAPAPDGSDPLDEVREALETASQQPLDAQVAVFERANEVLASELAALDEV